MNNIIFEKSRNFHPPLSLNSQINCLSEGNIHTEKNNKKNYFFITNRENCLTPQKDRYKKLRLSKDDKSISNLFGSTKINCKNVKRNEKFTSNKQNLNNKQSVISIMDKEIDLNLKKWKISKNKKSKGLFETDNFKLPLYVLSK